MFSIPTLVSFAVAAMFLLFLVTRFDIDWEANWDKLKASNLYLFGVAFASYYVGFILRGLRWQIMLKNANLTGDSHREVPSVLACSRYIFLGWFANAITWFRLGDAYRAYVFTEDTGYSFSRTIGTVLAERVLDVVMIFVLLVVAALAFYGVGDLSGMGLFLGIASLLVLAGVASLLVMKQYGTRLARFLPTRLRSSYDRFHEGALGSFGNFGQLPVLLLISFLTWFMEVGRLYFVIQSLDLSVTVSFSLVLFVTLANAILTTVPLTPGGLGIVEPGIVGLLTLSMVRSEAISVALLDRSISYLSIVVLGGVVFFLHQASRGRRKRASARAADSAPRIDS
ncbi:MAG: lysylphosphatidylglycerol synthase transmembrane domain-containing protein [Chloroflexi bacterium]|nr:lysylphosphatidylglycerol synthase transmembrane domain-containing protein [Chloroflexota bacterium]